MQLAGACRRLRGAAQAGLKSACSPSGARGALLSSLEIGVRRAARDPAPARVRRVGAEDQVPWGAHSEGDRRGFGVNPASSFRRRRETRRGGRKSPSDRPAGASSHLHSLPTRRVLRRSRRGVEWRAFQPSSSRTRRDEISGVCSARSSQLGSLGCRRTGRRQRTRSGRAAAESSRCGPAARARSPARPALPGGIARHRRHESRADVARRTSDRDSHPADASQA
ncbi:MAG: hypothetical protein QOI71_1185 [Gaiellales bacterium]|nr:hypothetical protein [Gaiellales bacterium]